MKRFALIFLWIAALTLCLGFSSCGDDDEKDQPSMENATGGNDSDDNGNNGSDPDSGENGDNGEGSTSHNAVDLGLSVKWADTNVGADSPEQTGYYFAWGETKPKDSYSYDNYKVPGRVDDNLNLSPDDDAATVNWGKSWRMPTKDEAVELIENCSWEWTEINGVAGQLVTGPNGASIFLPAAGCFIDNNLFEPNVSGRYWCSTFNYDKYAYFINVSVLEGSLSFISTKNGCTVRPVCKH